MRSNRIPDRVHVVRPPEQDTGGKDPRMVQIVRTLAQISDKLKRSEAERYELLREMREYRRALGDMEERNANTERNHKALLKEMESRTAQMKKEQAALLIEMDRRKQSAENSFVALEDKFKEREKLDTELSQRQARFERSVREAEDKLVKAVASQTLIDQRMKEVDDRFTSVDQRLDESLTEQARLDRMLEKTTQEKARIYRKVERLEEIALETQESLQARAMVLLTDQSVAAQSGMPSLPAAGKEGASYKAAVAEEPWWRSAGMQGAAMMALVVGALLSGWAINQIQQPRIAGVAFQPAAGSQSAMAPTPEISDFETIDLGDVTVPETLDIKDSELVVPPKQNEAAQAVLGASDEELMKAMEEDEDALAANLNEIAPAVSKELEIEQETVTPAQEVKAPAKTQAAAAPVVTGFDAAAFKQNPEIEKKIKAQYKPSQLTDRITPDKNLPQTVKAIEALAFSGNSEAQHDLAAIYTAGHGGVQQDFKRAALWFREAAEAGIANARYNLGVLNHQGLGVDRDLDTALYWYREAAKLGHPEAQYNLGIAHIEGIGTTYNPALAAQFFEAAANNGIVEAAYNLGLIYENGLMGEAKPEEALLWYKIAADHGNADAQSALKQLASSLQIGMEDVDRMVERMQQINISVKGRRAGPDGMKAAEEAQTAQSNMTEEQLLVAKIQELLKDAGLYSGPADGTNGPQTQDAIRSYQKAQNLTVTGEPSDSLLSHMIKAQ